MIRIAVCDDSPAFLQQIKFIIDHWDAAVAGELTTELFDNGDALLAAHKKKPFDIILLDIVMPLCSGIEAARELRDKDKAVKIVFLTASPEFAVESYTVKASNYLLKPIDRHSLFTCLEELVTGIRNNTKSIFVRGVDAAHRIPLSDIIHVESQLKHVVFFLTGNRTVETREPLYSYEHALTLDDGFFKCHRSYIINIHHVDSFSHSTIMMRSGYKIPIARSCQKSFEPAFFRIVFGEAADDL